MVDLKVRRTIYRCSCADCRENSKGSIARDHRAINRVLAMLDERQRRLLAGLLARRHGHGGIVRVAEITGLSRSTIRRGMAELRRGGGVANGRVRKPGGGRKTIEKKSLES
jgi:DNA-binding phage protein